MPRGLPLAIVPGLVAALLLIGTASEPAAEGEDEVVLDYEYYKERVAPIVHEVCGQCHADPRKRSKVKRHVLRPAPGRTLRERFHARNFEVISELIEPGNPAASIWLLKPLGPNQGGVTHGGDVQVRLNTPEYGTMVDFINGAKLPTRSFRPPEPEEGQPDFRYFMAHVEPVLLSVCAECHADRGKGRFRLITHERGAFPLEDHYANFETVLALLKPGKPERSRFLTKPLAVADGGIKHKGGDRIRKDDERHRHWVAFIRGERGPALRDPAKAPSVPTLTSEGLVLQVEDFLREGDLSEKDVQGADADYVIVPGKAGGELSQSVNVADPGPYRIELRLRPGKAPVQWGIVGGPTLTLAPDRDVTRDANGFAVVGAANLLDAGVPLVDARGALTLAKGVLRMDGRAEDAAWLSPATVRHRGVSTRVAMPHEEDGGDDVVLLFDMDDGWNGKFLALTDGGRRLVMGLVEGGRLRVVKATKARAPKRGKESEPRTLKVEFFGGVAVGSLDGEPLLHVNLSGTLGQGLFGVLTHGLASVHAVAALEEYEVYKVRFETGPVLDLPRGRVRFWVELAPEGGELDAMRIAFSETK